MVKLSSEDCTLTKENFEEYFDRVFDCKDNSVPEESFESPFPKDIRGYIHEKFQPKHLMCKAAVLRDDDNHINFEFLIEYGIFESDVEIYYGIKAISDSADTTDEFFDYVTMGKPMQSVNKIKSDENVKYPQRFKTTNNAHNGTFWLVWERIESTNTLVETIQNLETRYYKKFKKDNPGLEIKINRFNELRKNLDKHSVIDIKKINELKEKCPVLKKFLDEATKPGSIYYGDKSKGVIPKKIKDDRILTQCGELYYFNNIFKMTDVKYIIRWIFGYEWPEKKSSITIPFEQIKQIFRYGKFESLTKKRWQKSLKCVSPNDLAKDHVYELIKDIKGHI